MKQETIERAIAESGWKAFRGEITPARCNHFQTSARLRLLHKNPHHKCDTCQKPLTENSGPRCAPCINLTLRRS